MPRRGGARLSGSRSGPTGAAALAAAITRHDGVAAVVGLVALVAAIACVRLPAVRWNGCGGRRLRRGRDRVSTHRRHARRDRQPSRSPTPSSISVLPRDGSSSCRPRRSRCPKVEVRSSVSNAAFLKYVRPARRPSGQVGPKHCDGVRSSAARGRRRIGCRIWLDRNSVAALGLGNGSFECGDEPHARSAWRALFRRHHRGTEQMEGPAGF